MHGQVRVDLPKPARNPPPADAPGAFFLSTGLQC